MTLSSWNDTATRQKIEEFVQAVTDENGSDYVSPAERVAVFDNDGTLWCEQPVPVQVISILDGLATLAKQDPGLLDQPLYRAAVDKDMNWFGQYMTNERLPELINMLLGAVTGETQSQYENRMTEWLGAAMHPRFNKPYTELVFQPMVELLAYLRSHDFRVFMVSGGGMDFVRLFSEEVYGIPRENIIGSNMKLTWEYLDDRPALVRGGGLFEPFNDGPGKPVNIQLHIGRPPILVGGNSDGDVPMMEFAAASGKPYLNLLVQHDDAEREYEVVRSAEKAIEAAKAHNWTIISMKDDFKVVFPA